MPTITVTDAELPRVQKYVARLRMTPAQRLAAVQADAAAMEARLPEAVRQKRQAEKARLAALKPEERRAEQNLLAKARAEAVLAKPEVAAVVSKVSADIAERLDALTPRT